MVAVWCAAACDDEDNVNGTSGREDRQRADGEGGGARGGGNNNMAPRTVPGLDRRCHRTHT